MVLVLAGMVGYMYWQQNKVLSAVNSLASFVAVQFAPPPEFVDDESDTTEDDRVSVEEEKEVEIVEEVKEPVKEAPKEKEVDSDDLDGKTMAELKELLTKKGIPFSKSDRKPALIQLLKATA